MAEFQILDHLDKLESDGGKDRKKNGSVEKSYKCPACDGHNFLVDQTSGRYLCTANQCDNAKIRAAIEPPCNPNPAPKAKAKRPKASRHWDYFTEVTLKKGHHAVRVHRTDDGDGERKIWQESLIPQIDKPKPILPKLLPYGIEEARAAVAKGELVFFVEGEPCVDACRAAGITAICFQGGTGGLIPERDAGHIPPEQLVIAPDQDKPGLDYADKVAALYPGCKWFYAFPGDARWNGKCPSKGGLDIADWIAQGATKDQILAAVQPQKLEPVAEPEGAAEGVQVKGTDWIKGQLQECLDEGLDPGQMAVEVARIAAEAETYPATVKDLLAGLRAAEADSESAADVAEVMSQVDIAEKAISTIKLDDYFPPKLCAALQVFQQGIPYKDLTLLIAQLVQTSSVLKLGTRINGNYFTDWEVPLNLYGIDVGPSGARKTPLVKAIFSKPAELIRSELDRLNTQRFEAWEAECNTKKQNKPKQPRSLTHTTNEYTGEGLADQLVAHEGNGLALLVLRDEIAALFDSFGKYKQGGKGSGGDEQQLLEIFDGDGFHSLRVGAGRSYNRSHVSLYGGIQDAVLRRLIASGDANGKWARCIFVPLPEMTYLLKKPSAEAREQRQLAERILRELSTDLFKQQPRIFELDDDGVEMLNQYDHLCQQQRNEASIPAVKALKNKSAGKVLRIAGLLHLLRCQESNRYPLVVPVARLVEAIQLVDVLDQWTAAFHASASLSSDQASAVTDREKLLYRIHTIAQKSKGPVPWTTIRRSLKAQEKKGITAALAKVMLQTLHDRGFGELITGKRGGLVYRALRDFSA